MDTYDSFVKNGEFNQMISDSNPNWFKRRWYSWYFKNKHSGQVIPSEDAKLVMGIAGQISLVPCVCRFVNSGEKHDVCMLFMHIPDDLWGARGHFDRIKDVEVLNVEEAREKVDKFAKEGYVHSIWTYITPHIGALCNCDYPYCTPLRVRRHTEIKQALLKSEYIARVDEKKCKGCGSCASKCQFGAISISVSREKAVISSYECFGCGVCRIACENKAMSLIPRESHLIANKLW
jgi:ferredoxin